MFLLYFSHILKGLEFVIADKPSPPKYSNRNMLKEVPDADIIIQVFPLEVRPRKARNAPAGEFFQNLGIPGS